MIEQIGKTGCIIMIAATIMGQAHGGDTQDQSPQLVDVDAVNAVLEEAITPIIDGSFHFTVTNNPFPVEVDVDTSKPMNLEVEDLTLNDRQTAFSAKISLKKSDLPPIAIRGTLTTYALMPVLKEDVNKGTLLTANHIVFQEIPKNKITTTHIKNQDEIVGREVRSNRLLSGKPLRQSDIRRRPLVLKGAEVALIYQTDMLSIETKAKALSDGNHDDWIKVLTQGSGKVITAKVLKDSMVVIPDTSHLAQFPTDQGIT